MSYYFYKVIRKTIIGFLDIFNNIVIARYNTSGVKLKELVVPVKFGPKTKGYMFLKELGKNEEILPMISVMMTGIDFDVNRMTNRHDNILIANDTGAATATISKNLVPYNLGFNLTIWALHMVDIDQIYEQILPYFAPFAFFRIHIPELDMYMDVKVILSSCSPIMTDQESEEEARVLKWDNAFSCQTYLLKANDISEVAVISGGNITLGNTATIVRQNIRLFTDEDAWNDRNTETTIVSGGGIASETAYLEGTGFDEDANILFNYEIF